MPELRARLDGLRLPPQVAPAGEVGGARDRPPVLGPAGPLRLGPARAPAVGQRAEPQLPATAGLGVNTIHRYFEPRVVPSTIAITAFTPVARPEAPGYQADTNAKAFEARLPERFILGDAGHTRAFLGIDKRPGTPLDLALAEIEARIPRRDGAIHAEDALDFVRQHTNGIIAWTNGSAYNDGRKEFPWDKAIQVGQDVWGTFGAAADQQVGDLPLDTGAPFPVVPLERYLELGQGYCIQKALLAALILDRLEIPFRLVNGAVARGPGLTTGHTWLELPDGRVLDPAWRTLAPKGRPAADHAEWFSFGGSDRFANQRFPHLVLTD